jgi:hypothetical protein
MPERSHWSQTSRGLGVAWVLVLILPFLTFVAWITEAHSSHSSDLTGCLRIYEFVNGEVLCKV